MQDQDSHQQGSHQKNPFSLQATSYYSGFKHAHDTYNAITAASDGMIYYVLSSESADQGGQMFVYNPSTDQIKFLGDLTEICGEKAEHTIPQGKSHVEFYEYQGKLYFSTHVGVYEMREGIERMPQHAGREYPGGHFLSYDTVTGQFEDLCLVPLGEGIVTMTMDQERGHIYGITWPTGYFVHYDIHKKRLKYLGPVCVKGEAGIPGDSYRVLCRSLLVDPREGNVYCSTAEGSILKYSPHTQSINKENNVSLRLDYFGCYDFSQPGTMAYNWRKIIWNAAEGMAYGVHGNSGYLFRFDPDSRTVELIERITSEPSRRSGMFDQFTYGYLGFQLGPDQQTLYYLTGGPIYEDGKRIEGEETIRVGAKGVENLHLVTYHIGKRKYMDHGPVFFENGSGPSYVNSLTIG